MYLYFWSKEDFTAAAKALGTAKKVVTSSDDFQLIAEGAPVTLSISRDKVCKKIVTYDCEPLFTPEEVEAL